MTIHGACQHTRFFIICLSTTHSRVKRLFLTSLRNITFLALASKWWMCNPFYLLHFSCFCFSSPVKRTGPWEISKMNEGNFISKTITHISLGPKWTTHLISTIWLFEFKQSSLLYRFPIPQKRLLAEEDEWCEDDSSIHCDHSPFGTLLYSRQGQFSFSDILRSLLVRVLSKEGKLFKLRKENNFIFKFLVFLRGINFDNNFQTDSFVFVTWITIKRGYAFGYLLQHDFHTSPNLSIYINHKNLIEQI